MDNIPVSDYDNSATQGLLITLRNEHLASSDAMFGLSELDSDLRALGTETDYAQEIGKVQLWGAQGDGLEPSANPGARSTIACSSDQHLTNTGLILEAGYPESVMSWWAAADASTPPVSDMAR
ncbi:hypothetical protein PCANC_10119 [Puccinia coronata f. sp. avenae]|uniref:Uncharacterized protein n=1 Tax=Puccinia coronata f. sp. avenae TaxID=200324 RepID=A0A2N5V768_9BASI|nr:hypothetical protein PCANC_24482 [Puccinia coronata f. sp. avenae]PLW45845.1 hypothetical protein PCANC_10119 [Puccinia coronata f. sp. avenae]